MGSEPPPRPRLSFRARTQQQGAPACSQGSGRLYGREPIYVRSGGSVPITAVFQQILGADTVSFAFSEHGSNAHAPNEWFRVANLAIGRRGNYLLLEALGAE